jgi:hypothetical protein
MTGDSKQFARGFWAGCVCARLPSVASALLHRCSMVGGGARGREGADQPRLDEQPERGRCSAGTEMSDAPPALVARGDRPPRSRSHSHSWPERHSAAVVLMLPLMLLLAEFARERRVRIDHALELSRAYRVTAVLLGDVIEADDAYVYRQLQSRGGLACALRL